ncbi:hypothetical protein ABPG77_004043 [Micractinium sp. CCAP 211/92]
MDVTTESISAGCWDLLLEDAADEFSSKLLSQELALSQAPTPIHPGITGCQHATVVYSPASPLHQYCASQGTASRAGSPEPQLLAEQASQLNCGDAEAGNVNVAMAQLLSWSGAQ